MFIEALNGEKPASDIRLKLFQDGDRVLLVAATDYTDDCYGDDGWNVVSFSEHDGKMVMVVHSDIQDDLIATDDAGRIVNVNEDLD